jgi:PAN domain
MKMIIIIISAVLMLFLIIGGGVGYYFYDKAQKETAAEAAAADKAAADKAAADKAAAASTADKAAADKAAADKAAADKAAADKAAADKAAADKAAADKATVDKAAADKAGTNIVTCKSDGTWSALIAPVGGNITKACPSGGVQIATCKADTKWDITQCRTYSVYKNTDYKGQGDISDKYNTNPEECKTTCSATPNCAGFVTNGAACFFKTKSVNTPSVLQGYDYYYTGFTPNGPAVAPPPAAKGSYTINKNTDYKDQGDISEKYNTNPEDCKTTCDNIPNCAGFVTNGTACFFKTNKVNKPSVLQGYDYYKKA